MKFRASIFLVSILALWQPASADSEVGKLEIPNWVVDLPLEDFATDRSNEFQQGLAFLLSDRQVRKTEEGFHYFERLAYEVLDRSGLESAATIAPGFDPELEALSFHFLRIIRDGEVIDRLTEAEITLLRQEEGLDSSLIDGAITALIQIEDVRVGDIVDYSYSSMVATPLWPDDIFEVAPVESGIPLAQLHYRLTVPAEMKLGFRGLSTDIVPQISENDGWKTYTLHLRDPDPAKFEAFVPNDWVAIGYLVFTSMESWSEVVDWAMPYYSFNDALPADFSARLDEIAATYKRPEDRATQALRLVQDDIRYLGLLAGLGSHAPRPPAVTLQRGYGDCKDKSVLLVAALDYLGIDAAPALASTIAGHVLPNIPATIGGFDHVIVEIDLDGRKIWVDPTLSLQGGNIDTFPPLGYGYVLPIREGQSELVWLSDAVSEIPKLEIIESFEFPESGDVGMNIDVTYRYRSFQANAQRSLVSSSGKENMATGFLDYYSAIYNGITEARPLEIHDDKEANELVMRAEYTMDSETFRQSEYVKDLPVLGAAIRNSLPRQVEANRIAPLGLPYGLNARHVIRIVTPGRQLLPPESESETIAGITYVRNFKSEGEVFEIELLLNVAEKSAPPESIKSVVDLADKISTDSELNIRMESAAPTLARQLGLDAPLDADTEKKLMLVRAQVGQREFVKALTSLNTLIATHSEPAKLRGYLQLLKGTVLVQLGRSKAALEPLTEAFELHEPVAPESYYPYFHVLRGTGDHRKIAEVVIRMVENHPGTAVNLNMDWISGLRRDLRRSDLSEHADALVLALAKAIHQSDREDVEKFRWVLADAAKMLSREGDQTQATEYFQYLLDPDDFAELLMSKRSRGVWDDIERQAGPDLSLAISRYVTHAKEGMENSPDDFGKKAAYIYALRTAGKFSEAIEFAEPLIENWAAIEAVGDDAYWFVNNTAYAYSDAGQLDKALELMERLLTLGIPENSQLISMAINRALLHMRWGNFEQALEVIEQIEDLPGDLASDFGWMWIYDAKACSLHQLGRTEEAEIVLNDFVMPIADENPMAYTEIMLCFDELDRAADILIARLRNPEDSDDAITAFIDVEPPVHESAFEAEIRRRSESVRARPDVRREFDKVARVISVAGQGTTWGSF